MPLKSVIQQQKSQKNRLTRAWLMVIYAVFGKCIHAHCCFVWAATGGGRLSVIALGRGPAPFTFSSANWALSCLLRSPFGPERKSSPCGRKRNSDTNLFGENSWNSSSWEATRGKQLIAQAFPSMVACVNECSAQQDILETQLQTQTQSFK